MTLEEEKHVKLWIYHWVMYLKREICLMVHSDWGTLIFKTLSKKLKSCQLVLSIQQWFSFVHGKFSFFVSLAQDHTLHILMVCVTVYCMEGSDNLWQSTPQTFYSSICISHLISCIGATCSTPLYRVCMPQSNPWFK